MKFYLKSSLTELMNGCDTQPDIVIITTWKDSELYTNYKLFSPPALGRTFLSCTAKASFIFCESFKASSMDFAYSFSAL